VTLALLGLGWWAITSAEAMEPMVLPAPGTVASRMIEQARTGIAWTYLEPTIFAAALGALISMVVAIPLGIVMAHSRLAAAIGEPVVALSQTIPMVALAPLLVVWIGYGTLPIAMLCAIISFFPMVTTTMIGFRSLDMRVIENALLDGSHVTQRLWHVELPMAAPAILAGVRGGVVLAMTGAVVGELVMGGEGIGTLLTLVRQAADTAGVFALVIWTSAAALLLHAVVLIAERAAVSRLQSEAS